MTATIAVGFVFSAAEMQHSALLQRQLRFVALSLIEALRLTASTTIAVGMALAGFGYWALVASLVLSPLIGAVCLWTITRWIPGLPGQHTSDPSYAALCRIISLNGLVVFVAYNFEKVLLDASGEQKT